MRKAHSVSRSPGNGSRDIALVPFIWAYRPGRTVAVQTAVITEKAAMPPVRLTLAEPLPRTVTILGPDDRPLAGVRLAPVHLCIGRQGRRSKLPTIGWNA